MLNNSKLVSIVQTAIHRNNNYYYYYYLYYVFIYHYVVEGLPIVKMNCN